MPDTIRVAIVGATGYSALEAIRLLLHHPHAQIAMLCSRREPQPRIADVFPSLLGRIDRTCEPIDAKRIAAAADVAMLCLPAGASFGLVPSLLAAGVKVIDYSADYRLKDPADYERWYGQPHQDREHLGEAVYGLPERNRDAIRAARLVANPGCYPTSAALGILPFLAAGLIDPKDVIVDAASGISGAGREPRPDLHFPERADNFEAYKVGEHRHMIEIQRTLDAAGRGETTVVFTPHLIPIERGIVSTIYLQPARPLTTDEAMRTLADAYAREPFVRVRHDQPNTHNVARTNYCDITARVVKHWLVVTTAIDNLGKGAAGQAVQNMNLMCGIDETAGLR